MSDAAGAKKNSSGPNKFNKENPFEGAQRLTIPEIDVLGLLRRLLDPNEPWVIVPDGSLFGFFDFIPRELRVGPWNFVMPYYIGGMLGLIVYYKPESLSESLTSVYPELYSKWWIYNVVAGIWMSIFLLNIVIVRPWNLIMYTAQSWVYITFRHVLTALAPFLNNDQHFLLHVNEFLRFPALITATVTFLIWNFAIAPAIYHHLGTAKKRITFIKFMFSFRAVQLHGCNIVYAVLNAISVSPRRLFTFDDLWCALALGVAYNFFYFFILDRLGIHLYPNFSPRFKYIIVSALITWIVYTGGFLVWNKIIDNGMFAL